MESQKYLEALSWALKETQRRGGAQPEGHETAPANRRFWLVAVRGLAGLALFVCVWLALWLCGSAHVLGALAGTALVILAERGLKTAGIGSEYVLSRVVFTPTGNRDYDSQRCQGLYLALMALRPLLIFALCWQNRQIWIVPTMMLTGCIELDALEGRLRKSILDWRAQGYWLVSFVAAFLCSSVWGRHTDTANGCALVILACVLAWLAPMAKLPGQALSPALPAAVRRGNLLYLAETALLAMGVLLW